MSDGWDSGAGQRMRTWMLVGALLIPVALPLLASGAEAEALVRQPTHLRNHPVAMATVWNGSEVIMQGGSHIGPSKHIWAYDPGGQEIHLMEDDLPSERLLMGTVWTGEETIMFGGYGVPLNPFSTRSMGGPAPGSGQNSPFLDSIVSYDPEEDVVTTAQTPLPTGRRSTSAVWNGTHAFVFGGAEEGRGQGTHAPLDEILRYEPDLEDLDRVDAQLPSPRWGTSAVWNGTHAFIFGGVDAVENGTFYDDVLRYDPVQDTVEVMDAKLPSPRASMTGFWDGEHVYLFGGRDASGYLDDVLRYDPAEDRLDHLHLKLPVERAWASAVWTGSEGYVMGGRNDTARFADIYRFETSNQAPSANFDYLSSGLTLHVDASSSTDTEGPITNYTWEWGDGSEAIHGQQANHTYGAAGTYPVTLTVEDRDGAKTSISSNVTVSTSNVRPIARLSVQLDGSTVRADASQSFDPDGRITGYSWSWGDGMDDGAGARASHTYDEPGPKTITLTVEDEAGALDEISREIVVREEASPDTEGGDLPASFSLSVDGATVRADATAFQRAGYNASAFLWTWGGENGTISRGLEAVHTYATPGTKTIQLTVLPDEGERLELQKTVTIGGTPRFRVEEIIVEPDPATAQEPAKIHVRVTNIGTASATGAVQLRIGGALVDETGLTLNPADVGEVVFDYRPDAPGTQGITVETDFGPSSSLNLQVQEHGVGDQAWIPGPSIPLLLVGLALVLGVGVRERGRD